MDDLGKTANANARDCRSGSAPTLSDAVNDLTAYQRRQATSLAKRKSELATMQDRLLNAYLAGTVDEAIYKAKSNELKSGGGQDGRVVGPIGRRGPGTRGNGPGALRLDATGGRHVARFKQRRSGARSSIRFV